jgi:quinol monooxygenase YgiN
MSEPIVFISTHRIRPGMTDAFTEYFREGSPTIEATKPGTVLFQGYLDEAGEEVCIVHAFPDAAAMDRHMEGAGERSQRAYEYLEPRRFDIYGTPSPPLLEALRQGAGETAEVVIHQSPLGGFIRLGAG